MSDAITKKTVEHLARLARIELGSHEEEKLMHDLANILAHFEELKTLNTQDVEPVTGGTRLKNVFRDDEERINTLQKKGVEYFPDEQNDLLSVPPVFER